MSVKLKQLTVAEIRKKYWDAKTGIGSPIKCYLFQSYDGKDINNNAPTVGKKKSHTIIPLGILMHKNKKTKVCKITPDWLSTGSSGPYKKKDEGKSQHDFYYLGFTMNSIKGKIYWLQVCSGPLNVISSDCLDEVNFWVTK
jgi:hypothetical protein